MRYLDINDYDISNGPGLRVSFWVAGCPHHCKGCHNSWTWNPDQGEEFNKDVIDKVLYLLDCDGIHKDLSILGGEPLAPYNIDGVIELCKEVKNKRPDTNIWIWTGYHVEEFNGNEIFKYVDTIIDGPFKQELFIKHKYYGSSNQKIHNYTNGEEIK